VPISIPFGTGINAVNAYIILGRPLTLIDTGPATDSAYAAVRDGLIAAGAGLRSLEQIVITHSHIDHCGLAGRLQAESGAEVAGHPAALADMNAFEAAWRRRSNAVVKSALSSGVPAATIDAFLDVARVRRTFFGTPPPSDALRPLPDGGTISAGGSSSPWQVIYVPGHSPDHLALRSADGGDLVVGDLLLRDVPTAPVLHAAQDGTRAKGDLDALMVSWRRVSEMDAERAWPGHGEPIRALRVLVARRQAGARDALRSTRRALSESPQDAWSIAKTTGLPTSPARLNATLGVVLARLDWLVERGWASRAPEDGLDRYVAARPAGGARRR